MQKGPLHGFRVLELGQLIAGPFTGTLLAYFGAEVIKVEPPNGDPLRTWRTLDKSGTSLWWYSIARNKKSIVLDLNKEEGRDVARQLASKCDIIIENFRPGKLEEWNMGPSDLEKVNPNLIFCRISGYGQTGPKSVKTGFASVCEAYSGFRHINGFPGGKPCRPNISLGDSMAGIHGALGVSMALVDMLRNPGKTRVVDVSIFEAMVNVQEAVISEYERTGEPRGPSGSTVTGIVPTGTYACRDGKYVVIGANGDSIFKRLFEVMGRADIGMDEKYDSNQKRVEHQEFIDGMIEEWTLTLDALDVVKVLDGASVPAGLIYSAKDMFEDEHYHARGVFEKIQTPEGPLTIPSMCPKMPQSPGQTSSAGPTLGEHSKEILGSILGMDQSNQRKLFEKGIVK